MRSISPNITRPISIDETPILTAAEVGEWLNLSSGMITKQTSMLNRLILTTTEVVEKYAWLSLRRITFEADFDLPSSDFGSFISGDLKLVLQRAPILDLVDITKIEYLDENGVYVEFDRGALTSEGLYENVTEKKEQRSWASIYFDTDVPFDYSRINAYKIRITFIAGFTTPGDPPPPAANIITDIPSALKTGMMMIVADYYTNRGDCSGCGCDLDGYPVPCEAKGLIDMFSISKTTVGADYNPVSGYCCG